MARDARWFLEHGGFVDPKRIHHRRGPDFATEITSNEVEAGIRRMVEAMRRDNALAKKPPASSWRLYIGQMYISAYDGNCESRGR